MTYSFNHCSGINSLFGMFNHSCITSAGYTASCACNICLLQYRVHGHRTLPIFGYFGKLRSREVIKLAESYVKSIEEDREQIRRILSLYSDTLLKQ